MSDELSSRVELQLENMLGESVTPEKPRSRVEVLLSELNGTIEALKKATTWIGVTTTELTNGSTVDTITINGSSVSVQEGDVASYNGAKYVYNGSIWQTYSDTDDYLVNGDITQTTGQNTDKVMSQKAVTDKFNTKANTDGSYETLTSGNSYQLVSSTMTKNKTPYNFRTTGGSADVGDREYPIVHGGTLAWNQLVPTDKKSGSYITPAGGHNYNVSLVTNVNIPVTVGHKMFMSAKITRSIATNDLVTILVGGAQHPICRARLENGAPNGYACGIGVVDEYYADYSSVNTVAANNYLGKHGYEEGDTISIDDLMVFDLTLMFGSTIADYLYSLDWPTGASFLTGVGSAWFRKLFPKPYYAYNAGELESVQTSAHSTVGFNQFDKENYNKIAGYFGTNYPTITAASGRTTIYIPCLPNTKYCASRTAITTNERFAIGYTKEPPAVGVNIYGIVQVSLTQTVGARMTITTTTGEDAQYLVVWMGWTNEAEEAATLNINFSWDGERDGEYEAYIKRTYPLDDSLTLRGIPKLDSNNDLYYDGDTYEPDGTVTRRYGIVDLGTLNWARRTEWSDRNVYEVYALNIKSGMSLMMCPKYPTYYGTRATAPDKTVFKGNLADSTTLMIRDDSYTDAATFKAAMSGVYFVYELATPTTETAEPYQATQVCSNWGTEEFTDAAVEAGDRDVAIPVGHLTKYPTDLKAKLEMTPESPDGDGDYIVRQTSGINSYVPLVVPSELPDIPTTDGTYVLKATVSDGEATLSWVSE